MTIPLQILYYNQSVLTLFWMTLHNLDEILNQLHENFDSFIYQVIFEMFIDYYQFFYDGFKVQSDIVFIFILEYSTSKQRQPLIVNIGICQK